MKYEFTGKAKIEGGDSNGASAIKRVCKGGDITLILTTALCLDGARTMSLYSKAQ